MISVLLRMLILGAILRAPAAGLLSADTTGRTAGADSGRSADSTSDPFVQRLGVYDRDGRTLYFSGAQIRSSHALNPGGLLFYAPSWIVARHSFGGTLSDWRALGAEYYFDDKPVSVRVDGVELASLAADRVYWNNAPITGADGFSVGPGGGLSGGRMTLDIRRPDDFAVSPVTRVFWETGPFDMTGVQFLFSRSLGAKNGLFVAMEKTWQAEEKGFFFGPDSYSHPAAISDIYGAFLRRPDSEYVSGGFLFENDFKRWNTAFSSRSVPGLLLTAGFDYVRDFQDDFRFRPDGSGGYYNFAARHLSDRFYLKGRTLFSGPFSLQGQLYRESARLRYLENAINPSPRDSTVFSQGTDLSGGLLTGSWKAEGSQVWITAETRASDVQGRTLAAAFREERLSAGLERRWDSLAAFPFRVRFENDLRRDSRNPSDGILNLRALISPRAEAAALFFKERLRLDGGAGIERRYPRPALLYFENPKLNARPAGDSGFARIITSSAWGGAGYSAGRWDLSYRAEIRSTPTPPLLTGRFDSSGRLFYRLDRSRVAGERVLDHEWSAGLSLGAVEERLSVAAAATGYEYASGRTDAFTAWHAVNRFQWKGRFVHDRLEMRTTLFTEFRPEVWVPDFYGDGIPVTLPWFLSFDAELAFTIKSFNFYTRLDNLSNQVIRFDPGYLLPGPIIRWGVDWTFKG